MNSKKYLLTELIVGEFMAMLFNSSAVCWIFAHVESDALCQ